MSKFLQISELLQIATIKIWRKSKKRLSSLRIAMENSARWQEHWPRIEQIEGWLSKEEGFLLYQLAQRIDANHDAVEIGSYHGRSTISIASGFANPYTRLWAVDPHSGDITQVQAGQKIDSWSAFQSNISHSGCSDAICPLRMSSVEAAKQYTGRKIMLLFIDGWHSTDAVLEDFLFWRPHLSEDCAIVFDDWAQADISQALLSIEKHLPPCQGFIGKDLLFSRGPV